MAESCENCKYWVVPPRCKLPTNYRICERTETEDGARVDAETNAWAMDGEGYYAVLVTFSSFYCNQWRPAVVERAPRNWEMCHHQSCGCDYRGCHPRLCPKDQYEKTGKWMPWLADQEC